MEEARSWFLKNRWDFDRWNTISDTARMATFAILVDGEEIEVESLPTEVQCTQSAIESGDRSMLADFLGETGSRRRCEWLPVRDEITVIGRLVRRGDRRVLVEDPELGLFLSPHPPDEAGQIETLKAVAGFVGVILGGAASLWAIVHALAR